MRHKTTKPCPHMIVLLNGCADDTLWGVLRRYAEWHMGHCEGCSNMLESLRTLRACLQAYGHRRVVSVPKDEVETLGGDRWTALESQWDAAEHRTMGQAKAEH